MLFSIHPQEDEYLIFWPGPGLHRLAIDFPDHVKMFDIVTNAEDRVIIATDCGMVWSPEVGGRWIWRENTAESLTERLATAVPELH